MKIQNVRHNNRKKAFEIRTAGGTYSYPYAKSIPKPKTGNLVVRVCADEEIGREAFTYVLESREEGTVHIEQVLEYNKDPNYLQDLLLYKLTLEAKKRVASSCLSKREILRRLRTSATQLYRLLDQTNYRKSLDQLLCLLSVLDCDVDIVVLDRKSA